MTARLSKTHPSLPGPSRCPRQPPQGITVLEPALDGGREHHVPTSPIGPTTAKSLAVSSRGVSA